MTPPSVGDLERAREIAVALEQENARLREALNLIRECGTGCSGCRVAVATALHETDPFS